MKQKPQALTTDGSGSTGKLSALRKSAPLLPERTAGIFSLTAVIAIMTFLAVLTLFATLVIHRSVSGWITDLETGMTVLVNGADAAEIEKGAAAIRQILEETQGVEFITALSPAEAAALLEPWFGQEDITEFLNIPAVFEIGLSPAFGEQAGALQERIAAVAPLARLDDHTQWKNRLAGNVRPVMTVVLLAFFLIMAATCAVCVFAARAGLAVNHETISVLHLVGATDSFIARQVQKRFFITGLKGTGTGFIMALGILLLLSAGFTPDATGKLFLPPFTHADGITVTRLAAIPVSICLLVVFTVRVTVIRTLRRQY